MTKNEEHHFTVTKSILELYSQSNSQYLREHYSIMLKSLINVQFLIFALTKNSEGKKELANDIRKAKFKYGFSKHRKTSYLLLFNENTKRVFNPLINKIVMRKIGELKKLM